MLSHRLYSALAIVFVFEHASQARGSGLRIRAGFLSKVTRSSPNLVKQLQLVRLGAVPLPNDTISQEYLSTLDQAIAAAAATTPVPSMGVGFNTFPTGTTDPWEKVSKASAPSSGISADDLTQGEVAEAMLHNPVLTPNPSWTESGGKENISTVPYDMQLGASIMHSLSDQGTVSPPPSQQIVSEQFVAQCPMIMFGNDVYINAPRCGQLMGAWTEPMNSRAILHWEPQQAGGVRFGVDSVVNGNGSETFATTDQQLSLQGTYFELKNCMGEMLYMIEEEVMKVNHIGVGVTSSIQEHDAKRMTQAYFYKYTIKAPNGSAVAQTNLYRMGQRQINVTMMKDGLPEGALLAIADKSGQWNGADWKQCDDTKRKWAVSFQLDQGSFQSVATAMDLRVATAAMLTQMAFRDETTSVKTGVNRQGEKGMLAQMFTAVIIGIVAALLLLLLSVMLKRQGWDQKCRRLCFKFEKAAMPQRPAVLRNSAFPTTY